jgi:hypothetical protein
VFWPLYGNKELASAFFSVGLTLTVWGVKKNVFLAPLVGEA